MSLEMSHKSAKGSGIAREERREGDSRNWEQRGGPRRMRYHLHCWGSQVIQDGLCEKLRLPGERMGEEIGRLSTSVYTLPCLKWTANKVLLYSIGNSMVCGSLDWREV